MWFDSQISGLIGGIAGGAIGVYCAVLGTVAGLYARKGKFKKFVLTSIAALIVVGAALLSTGIVALITRQPSHVLYIFFLPGITLMAASLPNYFIIKKIYMKGLSP